MPDDVEFWRQRGKAARLAQEAVDRAFREHVREKNPDLYSALLQEFRIKTAVALPSSGVTVTTSVLESRASIRFPGVALIREH